MKNIAPFVSGCLLVIFPVLLWAQTPQPPWSWDFGGDNVQISLNSGNGMKPSVASNGKFYFVVWAAKTPSGNYDILGSRVDRNGSRIGVYDIPICTAPNDQMFPSVMWNGENFFVAWQDHRSGIRWDIYGALVTPQGTVLKEIPISAGKSNLDQVGPVLGGDGENQLVVWQGKRNAKIYNIYFTFISKSGVVLQAPVLLSQSTKDQTSPAVAFDGGDYLVVWQDKRNGKVWDIYGARVSPTGLIVDQNPVRLTLPGNFDQWDPVVAWNGGHYLVLWETTEQKGSNFSGRRVFPSGSSLGLDIESLIIPGDESNKTLPSIVWDGAEFLLVWVQDPEGASKIYGASILPQYTPVVASTSASISTPGKTTTPFFPVAALLGDEALVVWQEGPDPDGRWNIFGQIITRVGTPASGGSLIGE